MLNDLSLTQDQFILFQSEEELTKVKCRFEAESICLSLNQIEMLYGRDKSVISKHLKDIYAEGELAPQATVANYVTVQNEGLRDVTRHIEYYSLEAISGRISGAF